jgi:hypothetical protein
MSRVKIDDALSLADQIREKKSQLVKANLQLFEQIQALDDMLKDVIMEIYQSPDLTAYDTKTINQSLKLENILNRSVKIGVGTKDSSEACSNYQNGNVEVYFIDTESLSEASKIGSREDLKELLRDPVYLSDGETIRYWDGNEFDSKFSEPCGK